MTLGHVRTVADATDVPGGTAVRKSDFSRILAGRDPSRPRVLSIHASSVSEKRLELLSHEHAPTRRAWEIELNRATHGRSRVSDSRETAVVVADDDDVRDGRDRVGQRRACIRLVEARLFRGCAFSLSFALSLSLFPHCLPATLSLSPLPRSRYVRG